MARFWQRIKNSFTAPAQYIQTTDNVSRPLAVMSSIVMLLLAVAIILALFFAGKWAYNQIAGEDSKPANPVTGISTGASTSQNPSDGTKPATTDTGNTATVTTTETSTAVVSGRAQGTSSATSGNDLRSTASTTSSTSPTTVPNTGTGSLLGVFVIATTLGVFAYRTVLLRKL